MAKRPCQACKGARLKPEALSVTVIGRSVDQAFPPKAQLTIRVDREVLDWFRKQGRGYQTRINALLRAYMDAHKKDVA